VHPLPGRLSRPGKYLHVATTNLIAWGDCCGSWLFSLVGGGGGCRGGPGGRPGGARPARGGGPRRGRGPRGVCRGGRGGGPPPPPPPPRGFRKQGLTPCNLPGGPPLLQDIIDRSLTPCNLLNPMVECVERSSGLLLASSLTYNLAVSCVRGVWKERGPPAAGTPRALPLVPCTPPSPAFPRLPCGHPAGARHARQVRAIPKRTSQPVPRGKSHRPATARVRWSAPATSHAAAAENVVQRTGADQQVSTLLACLVFCTCS